MPRKTITQPPAAEAKTPLIYLTWDDDGIYVQCERKQCMQHREGGQDDGPFWWISEELPWHCTAEQAAQAVAEHQATHGEIDRPIAAEAKSDLGEEMLYCRYEEMSFPRSEFRVDPHWGLVHEAEPEHTRLGDPTADEPGEGGLKIPGGR